MDYEKPQMENSLEYACMLDNIEENVSSIVYLFLGKYKLFMRFLNTHCLFIEEN